MTMLEMLARAAENHVRPCMVPGPYPGAPPEQGLGFGGGEDAARAMLQLLRSPDEGMLEAMRVAYNDPKTRGLPEAFTAAIDHILTSEAGK